LALFKFRSCSGGDAFVINGRIDGSNGGRRRKKLGIGAAHVDMAGASYQYSRSATACQADAPNPWGGRELPLKNSLDCSQSRGERY